MRDCVDPQHLSMRCPICSGQVSFFRFDVQTGRATCPRCRKSHTYRGSQQESAPPVQETQQASPAASQPSPAPMADVTGLFVYLTVPSEGLR